MPALPATALRVARWLNEPARARALAVVAVALGTAWMLWSRLAQDDIHWLVDLQVYQGAGAVVRAGGALYDYRSPYPQLLPFTYPPFSGLLAAPLSLLARYPLGYAWTALELITVAWLSRLLAHRIGRPHGMSPSLVYATVFLLVAWISPVRDTFYFGQVNLFLMALIVADLLVKRGRWPRGLLVGIAAAVKLTPAFFIPYLWITGRRKAALVATATFAAAQLLALAIIPADSVQYWSSTVFEGDRLGLNAGTSNQSIRGMLLRFAFPSTVGSLLWVALVIPVAIIGLRSAQRAYHEGDPMLAVGLTGLTGALVSPVSWVHHFVWITLVIASLFGRGQDSRGRRWAGGLYVAFSVHLMNAGAKWIAGGGSYVLGRVLQESYLVLTLGIVSALPWRRHILAPVDVVVPRSLEGAPAVLGGEAASNGRS